MPLSTLNHIPKSFQTPALNSSNSPSDWLELMEIPPGAGTFSPSSSPPANRFPRFYDTAGPSNVAVVFRRNASVLNINWDRNPAARQLTVKIKAIEIKLRVYDSKNKTSRQLTLLQDL